MDYPGGFITKTAPTLNPALGNAAPGVWRLNDVLKNIKAGTWPGYDPYFDYTTLLLHGNGTNGGQNNTFLDSGTANSGSGFTITRNGNTTQGTFSPFSQTGWSNYFDGSGDYLTLPSSSNLAMGTGDFCIEMFVFPGSSSTQNLFTNANSSTGGDTGLGIFIRNTTQVRLASWNTAFLDTGSNAIVTNQWNHVAVCRSGTTASIFVNGTRQATGTVSNNFSSTNAFYVGTAVSGGDQLTGYISNLRAVKGSAVYDPSQTSITVPTVPFTAITNTQLLTCQSNRFIDNSANQFTITVNGNTSVQAFSPFAPTAAYDASTVGGSGYFDGSGDYLTFPDSASFDYSTGDFTCDMWVYPTTVSGDKVLLQLGSYGSGQTGIVFLLSNGGKVFYGYNGGFGGESSGSVLINTWSYLSFVRSSGTLKMYVNGVEKYSTSFTSSIAPSTDFSIGSNLNPLGSQFSGYLTSVRLSNTARSSSVPTTPITNDGNTQLLLNFTNAAIIDNTAKNVLETVGNAQISTTQSKFGGASLYFDGTGDYLQNRLNDITNFGTGDFTMECWIYPTTSATLRSIVDTRGTDINAAYGWFLSASDKLDFLYKSSSPFRLTSTSSVSTNVWTHVVVCRASGTLRLFINGTVDGSATVTDSLNGVAGTRIGGGYADGSGNPGFYLTGYIDDLRITKGIARYTANFTPQTSQWQDQ